MPGELASVAVAVTCLISDSDFATSVGAVWAAGFGAAPVPAAAQSLELSSAPTGSARDTLGVRESDSASVLDGAGAAASSVRMVEAGGAFKAMISCESLERSVFDEPGGLDFAIFEDFGLRCCGQT